MVLNNSVNIIERDELEELREYRRAEKDRLIARQNEIHFILNIDWMWGNKYSEQFEKDYSLMELKEVTDIINEEIRE